MVVLLKAIKPARLKDPGFNADMRNALRRVGTIIKNEDYAKITQTWSEKNKPEIKVSTHVTTREPSPYIEVTGEGKVWKWLNEGTRPHTIWAGIYTGKSKARALVFPSIFRPKSKVGWIGANKGFSGGKPVMRPYVSHPGIKARKWDEAIEKKRGKWFKRYMEQAMRDSAKASGHSR